MSEQDRHWKLLSEDLRIASDRLDDLTEAARAIVTCWDEGQYLPSAWTQPAMDNLRSVLEDV